MKGIKKKKKNTTDAVLVASSSHGVLQSQEESLKHKRELWGVDHRTQRTELLSPRAALHQQSEFHRAAEDERDAGNWRCPGSVRGFHGAPRPLWPSEECSGINAFKGSLMLAVVFPSFLWRIRDPADGCRHLDEHTHARLMTSCCASAETATSHGTFTQLKCWNIVFYFYRGNMLHFVLHSSPLTAEIFSLTLNFAGFSLLNVRICFWFCPLWHQIKSLWVLDCWLDQRNKLKTSIFTNVFDIFDNKRSISDENNN